MSENIMYFLLGCGDIAALVWFIRYRKRRKYHRNDLQYSRKINGIHELEAIANNLEALQQSILQIELATAHKMKGVTVTIPDVLSQKHESTILIDGQNSSSRYLIETLNAEKERLRAELDSKLERLQRYGSTETITGESLAALSCSPALDSEEMRRNAVIETRDRA